MKIEQVIVQQLYSAKQVTLQGIGTIKLDPSIQLPAENEKDFIWPENAFTFEYNLKAGEDEALIDRIVQNTRKIKPLATADLESMIILVKQFLNIGKPFLLEGVGTIQKNQQGEYEFIPGIFVSPKIDDYTRQQKIKNEEGISFESERKNMHSKRNLIAGFIALGIFLVAMVTYYFLFRSNNTEPVSIPVTDTIRNTDTIQKAVLDTIPVKTVDSTNFRIVIREFSTMAAAEKEMKRHDSTNHKLTIITVDSAHYQLAMPFTRNLTDTTAVKDSLKKIFKGNLFVK